MILRYLTNLKLAKELYGAAKPKIKGDQSMKDTFVEVFNNLLNNVISLQNLLLFVFKIFIYNRFYTFSQ
jgi:hypothetical protein